MRAIRFVLLHHRVAQTGCRDGCHQPGGGVGDAPSGARNLIMVLSEWVRRGNEVKILFACLCGFACQNLCT